MSATDTTSRVDVRSGAQAGNTLVLFPVAVLILFGLGAMALDAATIFLGQRRLVDIATSVATDAVAGVDRAAFYDGATDGIELERRQVDARTAQLLAREGSDRSFEALACDPPVLEASTATVTCHATVRPLLAPMWGIAGANRLSVTERVTGVQH
jgi:hypothetical protein